jgi:hypothetical protein
MRIVWFVLVATVVAASVAVSHAGAATTTCTGTVTEQIIDGNVIVPMDAECSLLGSQVNGNVIVLQGGSLSLGFTLCPPQNPPEFCFRGTGVSGNVIATGASDVSINFSTMEGNLVVSQSGSVTLDRAFVGGTATLTGNDAVALRFTRIEGNLQCTNNGSVMLFDVFVVGEGLGQCADASS